MNYSNACDILNLPPLFTYSELKKNYHLMALQYHPDKNSDPNSGEIFRQVVDAYEYLSTYLDATSNIGDADAPKDSASYSHSYSHSYSSILYDFIKIMTTNNQYDSNRLIDIFKNDCLEYILSTIDELEDSTLIELSKYCNFAYKIFNVCEESREKIREAILSRLKDVNVYILNPNLKNLINNDIYCLDHGGEIIYVPLWHHELHYNNVVIKCVPVLPDNIWIDDINNIHYKLSIESKGIFSEKQLSISIYRKEFTIPVNRLMIRKYQTYIFSGKGISKINNNNILDVDTKSNIIVHIYISDSSTNPDLDTNL